ncbi:pyridoxal phosphate-dependent aminotransferase [Marinobacterium sp. AK62]|uniref:Pyridoxal phosphate-dependent aminotransferase n=1 Tax=Marinobacterium alkalitolerans TaxID=1542925 RepID=A0ABS3ZA91_9GAMM|nr:pyridoxal phosphate-dependent aminotransferase [Marinobacterium alkalitolerans]MBP0048604.1 pyridoxal phosphate-dependent aminotransferase [Marinobacterium alkalitolerans]
MQYPETKLPGVGTTIFAQMSALAQAHQAINLSQGFPDFDGPEALLSRVDHHIRAGANQYAPMNGVPALCEAIGVKVERCYGRRVEVADEVTVTAGATEALFAAIAAVVRPGDEVILFDPAYDSYDPAITLNGGQPVHLQLQPLGFAVNWDEVAQAISPRTRMIILNTPHNPTGQVMTADDLQALSDLVKGTDILVLADEVYEHILFDGHRHQSVHRFPGLAERSFVVSSFGKTYHTTGWKIGYCIAPAPLSAELRKVHQYLTFSTSTPLQLALADYLSANPEHDEALPAFYQAKRDRFNSRMVESRFSFTPAAGTYFQVMDYSAISDLPDTEFVLWLIEHAGVAAIPLSVFCRQAPEMKLIRFCFAKNETTLDQAAERLCKI